MTGQYFHNIDAKGRLFIPAKLREQLGDTHPRDGGAGRLPVRLFRHRVGEVPAKAGRAQLYRREKAPAVFAYMADCEPDAQGRILIPNHLRQRAKLEKEVVVAGIFNRVEIWNAQRWAELEEEAFSSGSLEQAMEEMGL